MKHLLDAATGQKIRALIRAVVIAATAFGFKMDPAKIGAIQIVLEAVLGLGVAGTPNLPPPADVVPAAADAGGV